MCPIASGNWNNASNAGVWALNLNNVRANSNNNIGVRSDSIPHRSDDQSGIKGDDFRRVACHGEICKRRTFCRATEDRAALS